ncbi:hypothetical protein ORJ66_08115 [Pseudoalteromonas tunicata]|uniref:hypothetical protein n=1 Tax=Pseudoalteromonas tunicata TaxID=314281 RepID=UPI002740085F|nr:hypothetical protein [Pseudoalteromonas tunicata]MDP5213006.1 hypothetical protein [Pseudoalteromonas tunicata]
MTRTLTTIALMLSLCSFSCFADFDFAGKGTLTYPTGLKKEFEFGFSWQATTGQMRIGKKSYAMKELPESYSVALALSQDDKNVWVQEFAKGYFEQFEWALGEHTITLKKQVFSNPVKGDYVLNIDGTDYFFTGRASSLNIEFDEAGIKQITADGVSKDMGNK